VFAPFVEAIAMAKRLHRANPKTGKIAARDRQGAGAAGSKNEQGRKYHPESIQHMIEGVPDRTDLVHAGPKEA